MIFPPGCDVCLSDEFVKIVSFFLNWLRKSCKKTNSEKEILSDTMTSRHVYWYLRAYAFQCQVYDSNLIPKLFENHARVLPKSFKNYKKSLQNGVPEGSWAVGGVLPRGQEASGLIFDGFGGHLGVHFGTHLGSKSDKYRKKIDFEWFKELKNIEHAPGWHPTLIFHWFWSHFGAFWRWFLGWFWGVANTCTLT